MTSNEDNSNVNNGTYEHRGRSSKTARKFTRFFAPDSLPHSFSVNLDWLTFMVECFLAEPDTVKQHYEFGNVVLVCKKTGTPVFLHGYDVLLHGEPVANLFTHSRNDKIIKPGTAKLEILNHVLYSDTWLQVVSEVCHSIGIEVIKNISRLDIAIDGANHVHPFLNGYQAQGKRNFPQLRTLGAGIQLADHSPWGSKQRVRMLGKANMDSKRFNRKTGMYDAFKFGSGTKTISVYCKSREINEHSHKEYIRDVWARNGMDIEAEQWRVELRMTSTAINQVKDLQVSQLADPRYLLEVFKTQIKNFFEFVVFDDSNVTRATHIDLFQLQQLKVKLLEKVPRKVVEGAYKAKMAIHDAFKNIMQKRYLCSDAIDSALNHIMHTINLYNLQRFYALKRPQWILAYQGLEREAVYEKYSH